jgi:hypothetical protein
MGRELHDRRAAPLWGVSARAVPALSDVDRVFDADRGVPRESLSLAARARENIKTNPVGSSTFYIGNVDVFDLGGAARNGDGEAAGRLIKLPRNKEEGIVLMKTETGTPDWKIKKNYWDVVHVYMRDRRGDPDRAWEAYSAALAAGHSHEEIFTAAVQMTHSVVGKGWQYTHVPELTAFLSSLPVEASSSASRDAGRH